jgi:preprotein translocase subunit SecG
MVGFLMFLFVVLCFFLILFVLIQPGKGDMGLGSIGSSSQMLFGGSGGQNFFEKATWIMGALFIVGALGLSVLKAREAKSSRLAGFTMAKEAAPMPTHPINNMDVAQQNAQTTDKTQKTQP